MISFEIKTIILKVIEANTVIKAKKKNAKKYLV